MENDPDAIDADVREALAQALGERKVRLTDRRLLVCYLLLVAVIVWLAVQQQHASHAVERANVDRHRFESAAVMNCQANRENTIRFNAFVARLIRTYQTSPVLTPAQRRDRVHFFDGLRQQVPTCPPAPLKGDR